MHQKLLFICKRYKKIYTNASIHSNLCAVVNEGVAILDLQLDVTDSAIGHLPKSGNQLKVGHF